MSGNTARPAPRPAADAERANLLQAIVDAVPAHIAVLDRHGAIIAVNPAWRRFALDNASRPGTIAPDCDVGANYLQICDAARGAGSEIAPEAAAGIRAVMAGLSADFRLEYPCHSPDVQRWFLMWVTPLARPESGAVVVHVDITARKLAELAQRDSEMRLNLALEASGDGLWDWNVSTGKAWLSPSYYAMTGYRPDTAVSDLSFFQRLVHPQDWPGIFEIMQTHLRGESEISEIEYRIIRADGTQRWMHGRGRVVARGAAGEPLRMIGHVTDITERKRLEQTLRDSEARHRAVLEDQTEVITRVQPDGTFLYVNEVYCRFFGKTSEALLGRRWQPLAHPDDLPMIETRLAELSPANPMAVIENRVYAGDGSLHWMQFVNRAFFDATGAIREIQSVGRNITNRKRLEQEREALLEENTRLGRELIRLQEVERSQLAQELHDELSQDLVAVRAHAAALRLKTGREGEPDLSDAAAIEAAAGRIYTVSHRIMEGLWPQDLESASLGDALRSLALDWSLRNPATRLCMRVAGPLEGLDGETRIHLYRIVQECLSNVAAHARAGRARIWISSSRQGGRSALRLVCRDDGQGMDPEAPRRGYGLLIMRERARSLGGRLDLQSRPGGGMRIAVEIPLQRR